MATTITTAPNLLTRVGNPINFEFETDKIDVSDYDYLEIIFKSNQGPPPSLAFSTIVLDGKEVTFAVTDNVGEAYNLPSWDGSLSLFEYIDEWVVLLNKALYLAENFDVETNYPKIKISKKSKEPFSYYRYRPTNVWAAFIDYNFHQSPIHYGAQVELLLISEGEVFGKQRASFAQNAKVQVDISDNLAARLEVEVQPNSGLSNVAIVEHSKMSVPYSIAFAELFLDKESLLETTFKRFAFLGKEPIGTLGLIERLQYSDAVKVAANEADFFYFLAKETLDIEAKAYFFTENNDLISEKSLLQTNIKQGSVYSIGCGPGQLLLPADTSRYNISIEEQGGGALLGLTRHIDQNAYYGNLRLIFPNKFGGCEVLTATGQFSSEVETSSENAISFKNGKLYQKNIFSNSRKSYKANTGNTASYAETQRWEDLLSANGWLIMEDELIPIVVKTKQLVRAENADFWNMEFSFELAQNQ